MKPKKVRPTAAQTVSSPPKNHWFALLATKDKTAHMRRNSDFVPFLVGKGGIEPPLTSVNQILSLARLPIPPLAQMYE